MALEGEAGQAEVAAPLAAAVAVEAGSAEAEAVGGPRAAAGAPRRDGRAGSPPRQVGQQRPGQPADHQPDGHGDREGRYEIIPKVFWP